MNIQEAITSGKPFRREGWVDDEIFVVYEENDIALTLETDFSTSIELDVQDILANDWYTRDDSAVLRAPRRYGNAQRGGNKQTSHLHVNKVFS